MFAVAALRFVPLLLVFARICSGQGVVQKCGDGFLRLGLSDVRQLGHGDATLFMAGYTIRPWSIGPGHVLDDIDFGFEFVTTSFGVRLADDTLTTEVRLAVDTTHDNSVTSVTMTHDSPSVVFPVSLASRYGLEWSSVGVRPSGEWPPEWDSVSVFTSRYGEGWMIVNPVGLDPVGVVDTSQFRRVHVMDPLGWTSVFVRRQPGQPPPPTASPVFSDWTPCEWTPLAGNSTKTTNDLLCGVNGTLVSGGVSGSSAPPVPVVVAVVPELQFVLVSPSDVDAGVVNIGSELVVAIPRGESSSSPSAITFTVPGNATVLLDDDTFRFRRVRRHPAVPRGVIVVGGSVVDAMVTYRRDGSVRLGTPPSPRSVDALMGSPTSGSALLLLCLFVVNILWVIHKGGRFIVPESEFNNSVNICVAMVLLALSVEVTSPTRVELTSQFVLWSGCELSGSSATSFVNTVMALSRVGVYIVGVFCILYGSGVVKQSTMGVLVFRFGAHVLGTGGILRAILNCMLGPIPYKLSINLMLLFVAASFVVFCLFDILGITGYYIPYLVSMPQTKLHTILDKQLQWMFKIPILGVILCANLVTVMIVCGFVILPVIYLLISPREPPPASQPFIFVVVVLVCAYFAWESGVPVSRDRTLLRPLPPSKK